MMLRMIIIKLGQDAPRSGCRWRYLPSWSLWALLGLQLHYPIKHEYDIHYIFIDEGVVEALTPVAVYTAPSPPSSCIHTSQSP
jgi:hypothetical protein